MSNARGLKIVVHKNKGRTSLKALKSDQVRIEIKFDVNSREGVVSISSSGKEIFGRIWCQGNIRLMVEVATIERMGVYRGRRFECWTGIIPPY